jgi:predicted ATPase
MKIKFQNLGSIKKAELDLRPLTVIIGPNNSNKTYIAYSIYGLWKQITALCMITPYRQESKRLTQQGL